jgi:tetratricopeptide (TPR) repeat protein
LKEVIEDAKRVGDPFCVTRAHNTLGWIYGELQDPERSIQRNIECLKIAEPASFPDPEIEANAKLNLADALISQGRYDEGEKHLKWVERIVRNPAPEERWALWIYSQHFFHSYGGLCLLRGELDRAQSFAEECMSIATETKRAKNVVKGKRLLAQVAIARGQLDAARPDLDRALAVAHDVGNPPQIWKSLVAAGDLDRAHGRDGRANYREALAVVDAVASELRDDQLRETFLGSQHVRDIREAAERS